MTEQEVRNKYEEITKTLIAKKLTITTMESCTAGLLSSLITDTEGSSQVLKGAFVTYSNEAKIMQNVPAETIDKYGVYSEETAKEMALTCKNTYAANIGIGVTGTMGNIDPENSDSIPGEVYFAIAFGNSLSSEHVSLSPRDSRFLYKLSVADIIADKLLDILRGRSI